MSDGPRTADLAPGPSPEDIVFGRAVIAFALATKEQVEGCAADQKRLQAQGRPLTLAQVMVGKKLLSVDQYRRIVQEIQARQGPPAGATALDLQRRASGAAAASGPSGSGAGPPSPAASVRPGTGRQPDARGLPPHPPSPNGAQGANGGPQGSRGPAGPQSPSPASSGRGNRNPNAAQPTAGKPLLPPDITASGR